MDSINDLLNSLSPEDMSKLKNVANGLLGGNEASAENTAQQAGTLSDLLGSGTSEMLLKVAAQLNKESDKTHFIKALLPLLSDERRKKAEESAKFLKLMDTLPLLKGLF